MSSSLLLVNEMGYDPKSLFFRLVSYRYGHVRRGRPQYDDQA